MEGFEGYLGVGDWRRSWCAVFTCGVSIDTVRVWANTSEVGAFTCGVETFTGEVGAFTCGGRFNWSRCAIHLPWTNFLLLHGQSNHNPFTLY